MYAVGTKPTFEVITAGDSGNFSFYAGQYKQTYHLLQCSLKPCLLFHKKPEKRTNFYYYQAHILPTPFHLSSWLRG